MAERIAKLASLWLETASTAFIYQFSFDEIARRSGASARLLRDFQDFILGSR
jgi:hypothetical protein